MNLVKTAKHLLFFMGSKPGLLLRWKKGNCEFCEHNTEGNIWRDEVRRDKL
jgi:hypothetical protein